MKVWSVLLILKSSIQRLEFNLVKLLPAETWYNSRLSFFSSRFLFHSVASGKGRHLFYCVSLGLNLEQCLVCRHKVRKWKQRLMEAWLLDFPPAVASLLLAPFLSPSHSLPSLSLPPTSHLFLCSGSAFGKKLQWLFHLSTVYFVVDEGSGGVCLGVLVGR